MICKVLTVSKFIKTRQEGNLELTKVSWSFRDWSFPKFEKELGAKFHTYKNKENFIKTFLTSVSEKQEKQKL